MSQLVYYEFDFETVGTQKATSAKSAEHSFDKPVDSMGEAFYFQIGLGKDWKQTADTPEVTGTPNIVPLVLRKKLDANTPILMDALAQNALLNKATLYLFKDYNDEHINYFSVTLEKGKVISQQVMMPEIEGENDQERQAYEEIKFTFQKITYGHPGAPSETGEEQANTEATYDCTT